MSDTPVILYLYESALGLGHQKRASGIVNALANDGNNVAVASGTFVDAESYFNSDIELIRLAANRRKIDEKYFYFNDKNELVEDLGHDPALWMQERLNNIIPYAQRRKIDAIVAEWWPFERRVQFSKIIEVVKHLQEVNFNHTPLVVSSIRDVMKGLTIASATGNEHHEDVADILNSSVDHIMIHSDPRLVSLHETFADTARITTPHSYTGYVVDHNAAPGEKNIRNDQVIISCGAGNNGHYLLKAALRARPYTKICNAEWIFVFGPRMESAHREEFISCAEEFRKSTFGNLPMQIHVQIPELPKLLSNCKFSISYAGYNTTLEVLSSGARAILVPYIKSLDADRDFIETNQEQWERLQRLEERGMADIAHSSQIFDAIKFAALIDQACQKDRSRSSLDMNGAAASARILRDIIFEKKNLMTGSDYISPLSLGNERLEPA